MRKYRFTSLEKHAIWIAYEKLCFYCGNPLSFREVTIDHLLPEYLLDKPEELRKINLEYEIEANFSNFTINDFCNWVPSHGVGCNFSKSNTIFEKGIMLFYLHKVQKKLPKVKQELERLIKDASKNKSLSSLSFALKKEIVSVEDVVAILEEIEKERFQDEPVIIAFGLTIEDVLDQDFPGENPPENYPELCDWLEDDLVTKLTKNLSYLFLYTEASSRNGETLSVRLVFPELCLDEINNLNLKQLMQTLLWWNIVEVANFCEVYGVRYEDALLPEMSFGRKPFNPNKL